MPNSSNSCGACSLQSSLVVRGSPRDLQVSLCFVPLSLQVVVGLHVHPAPLLLGHGWVPPYCPFWDCHRPENYCQVMGTAASPLSGDDKWPSCFSPFQGAQAKNDHATGPAHVLGQPELRVPPGLTEYNQFCHSTAWAVCWFSPPTILSVSPGTLRPQ